mmetsp:Transcript_10196/g.32744  ORF Transcript_10196/g.32744 Transcript_10196/m.32744 type:complete len:212 (+) Transcript_10196:54-689(+)
MSSSCVSRYADRDELFAEKPTAARTAEQEYIYRLSLEAAEALAAAATMRRNSSGPEGEAKRQHMTIEDRLSLEAAEALTDVMQARRRRDTDVAMNELPPPPPRESPPTPEPLRQAQAYGSPYHQHRGKYRCGRCGQMKVNHVCPLGRAPLQRSLSVQTEPIFVAGAAGEDYYDRQAVLLARPRAPRDRVITVRRFDARKRSLSLDTEAHHI